MKLLLVAIVVVIALLLLTRRKSAPQNLGTVAPPASLSPASASPAGEGAVTAMEMDEMNRAAKERRQSALCARWWNV